MLHPSCYISIVFLGFQTSNDRQFLIDLFLKNRDAMFRTAYAIVEDHHVAEDMVQETCLAMVKNVEKISQVPCFKQRAYIVSMVRNISISYVVQRNRRSKYSFLAGEENIFDLTADDEAIDAALIREAEIDELKQALSQLSEKDQCVLRMKYFDECTDEEIAAVLSVRSGSVRPYLTRARRRLADIMRRNEE